MLETLEQMRARELGAQFRAALATAQSTGLTAASSGDHTGDTSLLIVALPEADSPVHAIGDEQKHVTLAYLGDFTGDVQAINDAVSLLAEKIGMLFEAGVSGMGTLGAHPGADTGAAKVWFVESVMIQAIHDLLMDIPEVDAGIEASADSQHPHFMPHMTIDYAEDIPPEASDVATIMFDRLAVWQGDTQNEYPVGDAMPDTQTEEKPVEAPEAETPAEPTDPQAADTRVPWHGVLAPENAMSGDRRMFTNLGRTRPLPIPLTWQKVSADGHDQNVTIATIEKTEMIDGLMHASGYFIENVEADELIGLIAAFGRFGVSVDADDIAGASFNEELEFVTYDDPRVSAACVVAIPAFVEAYVALGFHPILDAEEIAAMKPTEEALAASATVELKDLAPGITEDGPGWLTHPVDTDRLRDYWTHGAGAAKIAWGVPGDFNRCRANLAEYVKPEYLSGYCANRHYDALGVWPGQEHAAAREALVASAMESEDFVPTRPALTIVASAEIKPYPSAWFAEPQMETPEGMVFGTGDEEGRISGYIATWGVCHIGIDGQCTAPPESQTDYAYFATGEVMTEDGPIRVANLTAGIGHANDKVGVKIAAAHYDNTEAVWADVAVGENETGIWYSGAIRPFASEELVFKARAAGRLSGDWRKVRFTDGTVNFEMCGALAINVAGFPIPHMGLVAGGQVSLLAAGSVKPTGEEKKPEVNLLAAAVVDEMEARAKRREKMQALMARTQRDH